MKKHLVFVVNAHSGTVRNKPLAQYLSKYLDGTQYTYEIVATQYPKHGTAIAVEAAAKGHYAVIVIGGDGSINDVVKGLMHSNTALGIIPKGSGNGLARALKIPLSYKGALQCINKGTLQAMDVGIANEEIFVSNAGVGFDAYVMRHYEGNTRRGLWEYTKVIIKALVAYKPQKVSVQLGENSFTGEVFLVSLSNGSQYGYDFRITHHASVFDGVLDAVIVKKFPAWYAPVVMWYSVRGRLHQLPIVHHWKGTTVKVEDASLQHFQVDGEPKTCNGSLQVKLLKGAVQVIL